MLNIDRGQNELAVVGVAVVLRLLRDHPHLCLPHSSIRILLPRSRDQQRRGGRRRGRSRNCRQEVLPRSQVHVDDALCFRDSRHSWHLPTLRRHPSVE